MYFSKKFIQRSTEYSTYNKHVSAPYFRKKFKMEKLPSKAELTICGLGFYELYINGTHITKGKMAPYISNPDEVLYYDCYNIKQYLIKGDNVIAILLGNGFLNNPAGHIWDFDKAPFRDAPKLAVSIEFDERLLLEADSTFLTADSPIDFDDYRAGEHYDARKELLGWQDVDFNDADWSPALVARCPQGECRLTQCECISAFEELEPNEILETKTGFLYKFPYNQTGVCRLKVQGSNGQKISLTHGEILLNNELDLENISFLGDSGTREGYLQKDVYICRGEGEEIYIPHFTFHGFQYVLVEGVTKEQAKRSLLTYIVLHSNIIQQGLFECSDMILNRLQEMTMRSTISNFFYFPMDCPHREKNGWTGDVALSAEHILLNYQAGNSLQEWLHNVRNAQRENGSIPGIVPTAGWGYAWGNGPAWDAALIQVPYYIYKYENNRNILLENWTAILKNIRYMMSRRNQDGMLAYGLGDWCPPSRSNNRYPTKLQITDTLTGLDICFKASRIAMVLSDIEAKEELLNYYKDLRSAFRAYYIKDSRILEEYATQTALAMAIYYHAFEESEVPIAFKQLLSIIENDGGCFDVGVLGARVLFRVLADCGRADLAYHLITQKKFPSYRYWVDRGATTLWENFHELETDLIKRKDGRQVNSLNHHFWGDISAWFYRYLGGIRINPQLKDENLVEIKPIFLQEIDYCKAEKIYKGQKISVVWQRINGEVKVAIDAPTCFKVIKQF